MDDADRPETHDPIDGFLEDKKFVILDRDSKYSVAFRDLLNGSTGCCASTIEPQSSS